jgi:hypothetical protein
MQLTVASCLLLLAASSQAAPIPGAVGTTSLQQGPNAEGLFFEIDVHYQAFDGLDASDPLGVTPGKKQYAFIIEYVAGNENLSRFDVESTNGVPLIETGVSTNGTIDGVAPGTESPTAHGIIPLASGNPAARFLFSEDDEAMFGGVGARSVILVFTASNTYDVGTVLAQVTNTSLSGAGEVVGPTECIGTIEGSVFCLNCGPDGQVVPMEGITINIIKDGSQVASAVSGENGSYKVTGLGTGQYTVAVDNASSYSICSTSSIDVNVACNSTEVTNFCVCPQACTQQICVQTICDQNGTAVPAPHTWVGISGPQITKWANTGGDGVKCFKGVKIVPGHYTVKITAPKGYEVVGGSTQEFDLADCESKALVFKVCPIPPCVQTVCVSAVTVGDDGNTVPVAGVKVHVRCDRPDWKDGTTGADGTACFEGLKVGQHSVTIEVPTGYRLCDGDNKVEFSLARCESKNIQFVLCKIPYGPCAKKPSYWKTHPDIWPIESMWVGADVLDKTAMINILNGKLPNGENAGNNDLTIDLAQNLIAAKLSIAAGTDVADIGMIVLAADEFLLYDYPPGSRPRGKGADLARKLKNQLYDYLQDCHYCQP